MPSNQQRREAAKRKLERQLVRRQEREKGRRQRLIVVGVVAAVSWSAAASGTRPVAAATSRRRGASDTADSDSTVRPLRPARPRPRPRARTPRPARPPRTSSRRPICRRPTPARRAATISLNGQPVDVTLDRAAAPCTVNSFVSLASQGFYDSSPCWRLTGNSALNILQCGDPTGVGNGGPGYTFADELTKTKTYPQGHHRDGELGGQHQRLAVLHRLQGLDAGSRRTPCSARSPMPA